MNFLWNIFTGELCYFVVHFYVGLSLSINKKQGELFETHYQRVICA
jgi:hypothetical protein